MSNTGKYIKQRLSSTAGERRGAMIIPPVLLVLALLAPSPGHSTEHVLMQFELLDDRQRIAAGNIYISRSPHVWHTGLQSSYLQLRCRKNPDGKLIKLYSTVDHFDGIQITHQHKNNIIELNVVRTVVTPRLAEIRTLGKKECKELLPFVSTTRENYRINIDNNKTRLPFPGNLTFNATLKAVKHFW